LGFLLDGQRRYGDVFRIRAGPLLFHLVAHPDHVKHVLLDRQKDYPRSWYHRRAGVGAGDGLVTTEGAAWRRLRRMSQPAFHSARVTSLSGIMTDTTGAMLGRWREQVAGGEPLDVAAEFMTLTLRVAGLALIEIDLGGESGRIAPAVTVALEYLEHRLKALRSGSVERQGPAHRGRAGRRGRETRTLACGPPSRPMHHKPGERTIQENIALRGYPTV
jgi:cytochrome P450